ncbi:unnamed protein product, partial [Cyprideis torosa]
GILLDKFELEKRIPVKYDSLPKDIVKALVSKEDERYYEHSGIDQIAVLRAFKSLGADGGGSTISQQLAKLLFSDKPANRFERMKQKLKEWVVGVKLERLYTKEEIIELYLNKFDFIYGASGIEAAARTYFSKSVYRNGKEYGISQADKFEAPKGIDEKWSCNSLAYISILIYRYRGYVLQGVGYGSSIGDLLQQVAVLDIVSPTISHHEYAMAALAAGKHFFIEKPICQTIAQAEELVKMADARGLKGQVGHVERFNPAYLAAKDRINSPMFVEAHRLAMFNPRGTDVSVILDLMIHDLDIILHSIPSKVVDIQASGVNVISSSPDIANARIAFENGAVANLTASRISIKNMRKLRFFQKDAYLSLDLLEKSYEEVLISDAEEGSHQMVIENFDGIRKAISISSPEVPQVNAILMELETFAEAIERSQEPIVPLKAGTMGNGIAQVMATNGLECQLIDISPEALDKARANILKSLEKLESKGKLDGGSSAKSIMERLTFSTEMLVSDSDLVVEAATENEKVKLEIFRKLDAQAPAHCILASNTSSISITRIASATQRTDKVKLSKGVQLISISSGWNSTKPNEETTDEQQRKLLEIEDEIQRLVGEKAVLSGEEGVINANLKIGNEEQGWNAQQLKELTQFYRDRMREIFLRKLEIDKEIRALQLRQKPLQMPLSLGESPNRKELKLELSGSGTTQIEITYVVQNAGWIPSYEIRASAIDEPLKFVYKAKVYQNTGQDWNQAKLVVSTYQPNYNQDRPILSPLYAGIFSPYANDEKRREYKLNEGYDSVYLEMEEMDDVDYMANTMQIRKKEKASEPIAEERQEVLNIVYEVKGLHNIKSNAEAKTLLLDEKMIDANYKYHTVPKLRKDVYLLAGIENWQKLNLLKAEALVYFQNQYRFKAGFPFFHKILYIGFNIFSRSSLSYCSNDESKALWLNALYDI